MAEDVKVAPDATVVYAVWRWLNEWPDLPPGIGEINLDAMEKHPPAMLLQPLSATVIETQFINGSFVGRWPFAVVIKQTMGDDMDRIDSFAALVGIDAWMRAQPPPVLGNGNTAYKIEMTTLPMKSGVDNDGAEYYEASYALTYHHKEE